MVSAAGKKMPVFVSPVVVMAGNAAVPAAKVVTPVTARVVAIVSAAVFTTPGVLIPLVPSIVTAIYFL